MCDDQLRLMGITEVYTHMSISVQRLHVLRRRPDFPSPLVTLACGPIWRAEDIELYARTRKRTPGREPKQKQSV
jgi:hypothetical protein